MTSPTPETDPGGILCADHIRSIISIIIILLLLLTIIISNIITFIVQSTYSADVTARQNESTAPPCVTHTSSGWMMHRRKSSIDRKSDCLLACTRFALCLPQNVPVRPVSCPVSWPSWLSALFSSAEGMHQCKLIKYATHLRHGRLVDQHKEQPAQQNDEVQCPLAGRRLHALHGLVVVPNHPADYTAAVIQK